MRDCQKGEPIVADMKMRASYNSAHNGRTNNEIVADMKMRASYNIFSLLDNDETIVADMKMRASYNRPAGVIRPLVL